MDYQDQENLDERLLYPRVDAEDVRQEVDLRKWQGLRVSRRVIEQRMTAETGMIPLYVGEGGSSPWDDGEAIPSPMTVQRLVEWALTQTGEIQSLIWVFLDSPSKRLEPTIHALRASGAIAETSQERVERKVTLGNLLLRSLPATFEQLVAVVQRNQSSKRPQATVRQFIRRNERRGMIHQCEGVYHYGQPCD